MVLKFAALCLAGVTRTEISQPCIARPVLRHVPVAACVVNRNFVILPYQNPQKGCKMSFGRRFLQNSESLGVAAVIFCWPIPIYVLCLTFGHSIPALPCAV